MGGEEGRRGQSPKARPVRAVSEETKAALLEHASEVIHLLDEHGTIVYRNPTPERPLGHADGMVGENAVVVVHPDDRVRVGALLGEVLTTPGAVRSALFRARHADGSWRWLDATATHRLDDPRLGGVVLTYRDVTEREEARQELARAEKLASLGDLAARIGHEIANPLTYVIANIDLALAELPGMALEGDARSTLERVLAALGEAREGAARTGAIAADLALLGREDEATVAPVDAERAIERALAVTRQRLGRRARVKTRFGGVPPVLAGETRLVQALAHLLLQAARAFDAESSGAIVVTTRARDGAEVVIEIHDDAPAIEATALGEIFDPFSPVRGGMGLAIAHRAIASFGGLIEVESTAERGTTFAVMLRAAPAVEPAREDAPLRGRVLVVDDDDRVLHVLERTLARDHEVTAVTSARRALELIEEGRSFDAILCDVMMPEMSGLALFRALEQKAPDLAPRVVFITGGAADAADRELLASLDNPCLHKPTDPAVLRSTIGACVRAARAG